MPGLESGSGCSEAAQITPEVGYCSPEPTCSEQPLGLYDVLTFDNEADAHTALDKIEEDMYEAVGKATSPADAGDEAFTSSAGGGVRVENLVFFFRWLPKDSEEQSIDPDDVLQSVAAALKTGP